MRCRCREVIHVEHKGVLDVEKQSWLARYQQNLWFQKFQI